MESATVGQIVILLTTIGGFLANAWNQDRKRQWDKEDREASQRADLELRAALREDDQRDRERIARELAAKVVHTSNVLADKVVFVAEKVADRALAATEKLSSEIAVNTEISTNAFHEANTVNQKLEKLGLQQNKIQAEQVKEDRRGHDAEEKEGT